MDFLVPGRVRRKTHECGISGTQCRVDVRSARVLVKAITGWLPLPVSISETRRLNSELIELAISGCYLLKEFRDRRTA